MIGLARHRTRRAVACKGRCSTRLAWNRARSREIAGAQVFLKFENLQFTASFKERGACNKLVELSRERKRAA